MSDTSALVEGQLIDWPKLDIEWSEYWRKLPRLHSAELKAAMDKFWNDRGGYERYFRDLEGGVNVCRVLLGRERVNV